MDFCTPELQVLDASKDNEFMIFGDTFLRNYPVIFNKEENEIGIHK